MQASDRLIKKYPNRRLYDTKSSAYITLHDVKNLVLAFEDFRVVDAKSGKDLTRSILLQIILEEESGGMPLFSSEALLQIIRFYGHAMQSLAGKYLETNIKAFVDVQQQVQAQSRQLFNGDDQKKADFWTLFLNMHGPAMHNMMNAYINQSQNMFQQMQEQLESQTSNWFSGINLGETADTQLAKDKKDTFS